MGNIKPLVVTTKNENDEDSPLVHETNIHSCDTFKREEETNKKTNIIEDHNVKSPETET